MQALIIEDEKLVGFSISRHLKKLGYQCKHVEYGAEGIEFALQEIPEIIFLDYRLPDMDGIEILEKLQPIIEEVTIFFMTAYGTQEVSVKALKLGVAEYLTKPINLEEVSVLIGRSRHQRTESLERNILRNRDQVPTKKEALFRSHSPKMQEVLDTVRKLSDVGSGTVLLQGESGTGKDTLARLIHEYSPRKDRPFVVTNCASLPGTLLESELFGHEKGAFTDAKSRKIGQLEAADGGTLYLDEIGELPFNFQSKLLRFAETLTFYRVGGTHEHKVNVRIIAATNRNLKKEMAKGNFREDLFFRLSVIALHMPSLRDRKDDIPELVTEIIRRLNEELSMHVQGINSAALECMKSYGWPGNIREMKNVLERIFLLEHPEIIDLSDLPSELLPVHSSPEALAAKEQPVDEMFPFFDGKELPTVEKMMVEWALSREGNNRTRAARRLGITRDQVRYLIKKYEID